jgi:hypothetical protein
MNNKYLTTPSCILAISLSLLNTAESQELTIDKISIVAQNDAISPLTPAQDMPMGQDPSGTTDSLLPEDDIVTGGDDDLFGTKGGGYVHPFLSVAGEYTDNLFNVFTNEKSNFLTTLSPGIWLAVPRTKEVPLAIAPNNTTAGGLQMALPDYEGFERYNAYLLGALDFKYYSENSDLNDYDANVEGFFKLNLKSGLSFQIIDHFTRSQDRFDVGNAIADNLRRYYSNIAIGDITWDITEKVGLKAEYSNFFLDYKEEIDNFLNRNDNALSLYGFYKYSLKTALFLEYKYIDVSYDTTERLDNEQNFLYAGMNWIVSAKTAFRFKAGYQTRDYKNDVINAISKNSENSNNDGLALELDVQYQITEKTNILLALHHEIDETDSTTALDKKILGGVFRYEQEFFENFIGMVDCTYENASYNQTIGTKREDNRYTIKPALQYIFSDWLMAELAYEWEKRDSTDEIYDYNTNTVSFSLNSAL